MLVTLRKETGLGKKVSSGCFRKLRELVCLTVTSFATKCLLFAVMRKHVKHGRDLQSLCLKMFKVYMLASGARQPPPPNGMVPQSQGGGPPRPFLGKGVSTTTATTTTTTTTTSTSTSTSTTTTPAAAATSPAAAATTTYIFVA